MKRLFVLQVLLFFDWPELLIGADVSEEPSHDKFVVHIPIPIPITFKYPQSFLKITESDGKRQHSLEFFHPKRTSSHSHHEKHYKDDRKPKSKKKPLHHSRGSTTGNQYGKKAKQTRDEEDEDKIQMYGHEGIDVGSRGQVLLPQYGKGQGHFHSFFEQDRFRIEEKLKHEFENPTKDYFNRDSLGIDKDHYGRFNLGGGADRGQKFGPDGKTRDDRRSVYGQKKKSNFHGGSSANHNHPSKSHRNGLHGGKVTLHRPRNKHLVSKQRERSNRSKNLDLTYKGSFHPDFDSLKSERPETEETNLDFHSENASFNYGPFPSPPTAGYDKAKGRAQDLGPNWADDGLISPFALNDVLFKDKKYSKKVFKELGFYPLFLPYEVNENQER